jgi:hypothetical protein
MTAMDDDHSMLISMEEAARSIPGATAETLKRKARHGELAVYRIGKRYSTTRADVLRMIELSRVKRQAWAPQLPPVVESYPSLALETALTILDRISNDKEAEERRRLKAEERERTKPEREFEAKERRRQRARLKYQQMKRERLKDGG